MFGWETGALLRDKLTYKVGGKGRASGNSRFAKLCMSPVGKLQWKALE